MKGERQAIVTELRNLRDNRTVVVYTNDNRVYRKLQDLGKPVKIVPYQQEQGGKVAIVGVETFISVRSTEDGWNRISGKSSKRKVPCSPYPFGVR